jgi:rhamnosyltransferase
VLVDHELGAPTLHRVFGRVLQTSNHSPLRHYYMTRNHVTLLREYGMREPGWAGHSLRTGIKSLILMLLLERGRATKLRFALRGLRDGVFGRLGRYG